MKVRSWWFFVEDEGHHNVATNVFFFSQWDGLEARKESSLTEQV